MARKDYAPEQAIGMLREADVWLTHKKAHEQDLLIGGGSDLNYY